MGIQYHSPTQCKAIKTFVFSITITQRTHTFYTYVLLFFFTKLKIVCCHTKAHTFFFQKNWKFTTWFFVNLKFLNKNYIFSIETFFSYNVKTEQKKKKKQQQNRGHILIYITISWNFIINIMFAILTHFIIICS